jgi:predicted RNase H-like HicB family nuclease
MTLIENGYTYQTRYSDEDNEYVGTCLQFPSLSWLDPDREKALEGIKRLVRNVIEDMRHNGEKIPMP